MASVRLEIGGEKFTATSSGNGPVDAALSAVKQIVTRHVTLEEFLIQAINKGSDDFGKVHMTISYGDRTYNGFGAHTDIITASVEAFIDGINKIPVSKK